MAETLGTPAINRLNRMFLTTHAIESIGFTLMPEGEHLSAAFHSLHVFEARGFTVQDGVPVSVRCNACSNDCDVAIGPSVNAACEMLVGDGFTDDEKAWANKRKSVPPYAVVHFGPTREHMVTGAHWKRHEGDIITYDAFPAAKAELSELEAATLPSIEMALDCAFAERGNATTFVPIARTVYGVTPDGTTVHDLHMTGTAELRVSSPLTTSVLEAGLTDFARLASSVDPRVARFFQLGARDKDDLKRFLYFFLAVEIEVHRTFRRVSRAEHLRHVVAAGARAGRSVAQLLETRDNWRNLADRFVWCVVSVWTGFSDDDVDEFKRLKSVRDGIAHGRIPRPQRSDVLAIQRLAQRIHDGS